MTCRSPRAVRVLESPNGSLRRRRLAPAGSDREPGAWSRLDDEGPRAGRDNPARGPVLVLRGRAPSTAASPRSLDHLTGCGPPQTLAQVVRTPLGSPDRAGEGTRVATTAVTALRSSAAVPRTGPVPRRATYVLRAGWSGPRNPRTSPTTTPTMTAPGTARLRVEPELVDEEVEARRHETGEEAADEARGPQRPPRPLRGASAAHGASPPRATKDAQRAEDPDQRRRHARRAAAHRTNHAAYRDHEEAHQLRPHEPCHHEPLLLIMNPASPPGTPSLSLPHAHWGAIPSASDASSAKISRKRPCVASSSA